jgi:hypothetical protein
MPFVMGAAGSLIYQYSFKDAFHFDDAESVNEYPDDSVRVDDLAMHGTAAVTHHLMKMRRVFSPND